MIILIALLPILLGFLGLYILKLNETKKFLSTDAFNLIGLLSITANLTGSFLCLTLLFRGVSF